MILDDSNVVSFDPNYKVDPPLRTKDDIDALIEGINDGTIDIITHTTNLKILIQKNVNLKKQTLG